MEKVRIEWVDIFKCLIIFSVVIGHSTGLFSIYIYQFHMAAFFFISGYTSSLNKKSFFGTLFSKLYSLYLPIYVMFFGLLFIVWTTNKFGLYNYFFSGEFVGVKFAIKEQILNGNNYINVLGATWFLAVLFMIFILQKLILTLRKNVDIIYISISIIIYIIGYIIIEKFSSLSILNISIGLVFIGQVFFSMGLFMKVNGELENRTFKKGFFLFAILVSAFTLMYLGRSVGNTVDYPSKSFGNLIFNFLGSGAGILIIFCFSKILEKIYSPVKKILIYIGKNTIGILFLHFIGFKVAFFILYKLEILNANAIRNLVPDTEIGNKYWWFISLIGIIVSLFVWEILKRIPIVSSLLGLNIKLYNKIYNYMLKTKPINLIRNIINLLIKSIKQKIKVIEKKDFLIAIAYIVLICIPLVFQAITNNDELLTRFQRMSGISGIFKADILMGLSNGRILGMLLPSRCLSFISENIFISRIFDIVLILLCVTLFMVLLKKIFKDTRFSLFVGFIIVSCLPVTFEHAMPNAFVAIVCVPVSVLLIAILLYIKYIECNKKSYLILSGVLYFFGMCGYEYIVVYGLLFYILAFYFRGYNFKISLKEIFRKIKNDLMLFIVPLISLVLFMFSYVLQGKLFPSGYEGNTIGFVSLQSSMEIITTLVKSSIPGYYLFNAKYNYLYSSYGGGLNATDFLDFRIIFIILLGIIILFKFTMKINNKKLGVLSIFSGILFIILPTIPNSIAKLYQGTVSSEYFTSLPVSWVLYLASVFVICKSLWFIFSKISYEIRQIFCIVIILLIAFVQIANAKISNEEYSNYKRLENIEGFLKTQTVFNINNKIIDSGDIYETRNTLGINNGYWTEYGNYLGINITFNNVYNTNKIELFMIDDKYFVLSDGENILISSLEDLSGFYKVEIYKDDYEAIFLTNGVLDNNYYMYYLKKIGDKYIQEEYNPNFLVFE